MLFRSRDIKRLKRKTSYNQGDKNRVNDCLDCVKKAAIFSRFLFYGFSHKKALQIAEFLVKNLNLSFVDSLNFSNNPVPVVLALQK